MAFYSSEERQTILGKLSIIEHHTTIYLETLKRTKKKNHLAAWAYENLEKCLKYVKRGLNNQGNTFELFLCIKRSLQYINIANNRYQGAFYKEKFTFLYELLSALLPVDYGVQLILFDTEEFVSYVDHHLEAAKNYLKYCSGKIGSYFNKSFRSDKQHKRRTYYHTPSVFQLELKLI